MKIDTKKVDDTHLQIDFKISKAEADISLNEVAAEFQPRAKVNGFRDGKAPLSVIKGRYRKEVFAEATTRLMYNGTSKAFSDNDLKNVSNPVLLEEFRPTTGKQYVGKFHLDGSFSFSVVVELPPDIDVTDYLNVEVEVDAKDFDGWIKNKIKEQQQLYGTKSQVDRPIIMDDEIVVDFEAFVGGDSGGKEENYRMIVGQGDFQNGFEESFIGHVAGDEFETDIRFPVPYHPKSLEGKLVTFKSKVHEVYELVPHELNDDLAMLLSYDCIDDMMVGLKESWDFQFEESVRAQTSHLIMDKILESNDFIAPQAWIDAESQNTLGRLNLKADKLEEVERNTLREVSERTVKVAYILDKIYEKEESIHLTPEEFKEFADKEAMKHDNVENGEKLIETIKQNGQYEGFVSLNEQHKTLAFLLENAIITEK